MYVYMKRMYAYISLQKKKKTHIILLYLYFYLFMYLPGIQKYQTLKNNLIVLCL